MQRGAGGHANVHNGNDGKEARESMHLRLQLFSKPRKRVIWKSGHGEPAFDDGNAAAVPLQLVTLSVVVGRTVTLDRRKK
jgi:hypothetical protein